MTLKDLLEPHLNREPITHWNLSALKAPLSLNIYEQWLAQNHHAEMGYMSEHLKQKKDISLVLPSAKSVITMAFSYFPKPLKAHSATPKALNVALYAKGDDYHNWIPHFINPLLEELKLKFPKESFYFATDSKPILERDLHYQSRMGWFGKNSCLIHPEKGSLFLLAEILTTLELDTSENSTLLPLPDFCGTCTKCIDTCPTSAINSNRTLDANKCISYLTIESQSIPPQHLRVKMGDWFFGCDICQTVCPWNEKIFRKSEIKPPSSFNANSQQLEIELKEILLSSGKALERKYSETPLMRARPFGLKRNALIVIGNLKLKNCKEEVEKFLTHERLSELAEWTLTQLEA